jgi:hypothetical protein
MSGQVEYYFALPLLFASFHSLWNNKYSCDRKIYCIWHYCTADPTLFVLPTDNMGDMTDKVILGKNIKNGKGKRKRENKREKKK